MNQKIIDAIEVLEQKLEEQQRAVIETKRVINSLLQTVDKEPRYQDLEIARETTKIRPDAYYGKPLATAIREFLEWHGVACQVEDILNGLTKGGFDFEWKQKDRLRNLAINISKNTAAFHKLPNGMIGLLEWYPEAQKKREKALNNTEATEEDDTSKAEKKNNDKGEEIKQEQANVVDDNSEAKTESVQSDGSAS